MNAFWDRIRLDAASGAIYDGDRRYVMIRPDVLMGTINILSQEQQKLVLAAFSSSAFKHGGASVRAYRDEVAKEQMSSMMIEAAAALGWGKWEMIQEGERVILTVKNSPFAHGYGAANHPVCAPIAGIFKSLASGILNQEIQVEELTCAAVSGGDCCFIAEVEHQK